jgi:hypothetical protein
MVPIKPRKTMFVKPKSQALADIVSLRNPDSAKGSVIELTNEFEGAQTQDKRLRIARATMVAGNRASASAKRINLSTRERQEFIRIYHIYNMAAKSMFAIYKSGIRT